MVLPLIVTAGARLGTLAGRGARGARKAAKKAQSARRRMARISPKEEEQKPSLFSAEGIIMLMLAFIIDAVNILLGFLDFVLVGLILSPIWNVVALATVGLWLWSKTGQGLGQTKRNKKLLLRLSKRIALPFIGNSIPIAKFFPFWVWSVWGALDKHPSPPVQKETAEPQTAAAGAY